MHENGASLETRFLALLRPIERDLENYCRRSIWQPEDAADAIQSAVFRAYSAFGRYREQGSFRAWIFKILTREIIALNRRHVRVARHEVQMDPEDLAVIEVENAANGCVGDSPFAAELDLEVSAGLQSLTETERAVLLLRSTGALRYREIAESLDIPIGSVMGSLARARQKMRKALVRSIKRESLSREI